MVFPGGWAPCSGAPLGDVGAMLKGTGGSGAAPGPAARPERSRCLLGMESPEVKRSPLRPDPQARDVRRPPPKGMLQPKWGRSHLPRTSAPRPGRKCCPRGPRTREDAQPVPVQQSRGGSAEPGAGTALASPAGHLPQSSRTGSGRRRLPCSSIPARRPRGTEPAWGGRSAAAQGPNPPQPQPARRGGSSSCLGGQPRAAAAAGAGAQGSGSPAPGGSQRGGAGRGQARVSVSCVCVCV